MSTSQKSKSSQVRDHKAFSDHINELRMRVMWVALVFIVTSAIAYNYRDILVQIVLAPLGDQKLVYLTPSGGFAFIFQITMYAGAVVTAPLLVYQLYKFVQPALPSRATHHSLRVVLASIALMIGGVCFGYFVAVPAALHFLTAFAGSYIEANLTADSYLNFIVAYVVGLGLLFQLPLLLVFWNWIRPMTPKKLLSSQKFIILFAFIAAAMLTPTPDPTNQAMIAVPIILIYQIGVIAVLIINRSARSRAHHKRTEIIAKPAVQREVVLPSLPATSSRDVPQPTATAHTVTQTPKPVPALHAAPGSARMIGGIEGIRHTPSRRPVPVRASMQRTARETGLRPTRLIAPQRTVVNRQGRPGISMDGVSRVFSA